MPPLAGWTLTRVKHGHIAASPLLRKLWYDEKMMVIHCDKCSGRNKNKFVLWYLTWRILRDFHNEITINFLPVGYTKFAPSMFIRFIFTLQSLFCNLGEVWAHGVERRGRDTSLSLKTNFNLLLLMLCPPKTAFQNYRRTNVNFKVSQDV